MAEDQAFSDFVYHGGSSFGIIPYYLQGWFLILMLILFAIGFGYVLYQITIDDKTGTIQKKAGTGKRK